MFLQVLDLEVWGRVKTLSTCGQSSLPSPHLSRVHNMTQGLALRRVSRALTLVATYWNAARVVTWFTVVHFAKMPSGNILEF